MTHETVREFRKEHESLAALRLPWEGRWQEAAEFILPTAATFAATVTGSSDRFRKLFDATAVFANEMFAAMLAGQLINPSIKWFGLSFENEELSEAPGAKKWLAATREVLLNVFNTSASNFYPQTHEMFLEIGAFGLGTMFVGKNPSRGIYFDALPLGEVFVAENVFGEIDKLHRKYKLNLGQAIEFFGEERLPDKMLAVGKKEAEKLFTFVQIVRPRAAEPDKLDAAGKPWLSLHFSLEPEAIIADSGFNQFPFMTPRWTKIAGEVYANGPGQTVLPDIRMLQKISETFIRAAQKAVDPALQAPDDGFFGPVRTSPGAINFFRAGSRDRIEPLLTGSNPSIGLDVMNHYREFIMRGFFLDLRELTAPEPRVTATAVLDRRDERFRRMSPMIARLQTEFLSPLIERVFELLAEDRALPEPPPELAGARLKVRFVSPAAMAQEVNEAEQMFRFIGNVSPVLSLDPNAAAVIDWGAFVRRMAENLSVPPDVIRDALAVQQMRQEQAEATQATRDIQDLASGAGAAADIGEAVQKLGGV